MSECAQIVAVLKRSLKARGMTYRHLAAALELSEASVKRIFAEETFSLGRLEQICTALGLSIAEVVRMAAQQTTPGGQHLTLAQEGTLASDPQLFATFYLLLNGREPLAIAAELGLNERELRRLFVRLDAEKLIELQPRLRVRLRTSHVIAWRSDGPVRKLYERQIKSEFLQGDFTSPGELINFCSAELSDASARILARKVESLARDFADLAALDAGIAHAERRSMGLMLALRPWVFSMYQGLRSKG
ncbi:MAG TPA: helix-turn-helix transcriptional regulator [Povalibacter sp.]|nr:helix-turn-helix transcriptional regulator [Povalibacter sp.]